MNVRVNGSMLDFGARRIFAKIVIAFPFFRRSNGPRHKAATAVWADIAQDGINARGTERTFISTDASLKRIRWQRLVAMLAGRSEFKHGFSFS